MNPILIKISNFHKNIETQFSIIPSFYKELKPEQKTLIRKIFCDIASFYPNAKPQHLIGKFIFHLNNRLYFRLYFFLNSQEASLFTLERIHEYSLSYFNHLVEEQFPPNPPQCATFKTFIQETLSFLKQKQHTKNFLSKEEIEALIKEKTVSVLKNLPFFNQRAANWHTLSPQQQILLIGQKHISIHHLEEAKSKLIKMEVEETEVLQWAHQLAQQTDPEVGYLTEETIKAAVQEKIDQYKQKILTTTLQDLNAKQNELIQKKHERQSLINQTWQELSTQEKEIELQLTSQQHVLTKDKIKSKIKKIPTQIKTKFNKHKESKTKATFLPSYENVKEKFSKILELNHIKLKTPLELNFIKDKEKLFESNLGQLEDSQVILKNEIKTLKAKIQSLSVKGSAFIENDNFEKEELEKDEDKSIVNIEKDFSTILDCDWNATIQENFTSHTVLNNYSFFSLKAFMGSIAQKNEHYEKFIIPHLKLLCSLTSKGEMVFQQRKLELEKASALWQASGSAETVLDELLQTDDRGAFSLFNCLKFILVIVSYLPSLETVCQELASCKLSLSYLSCNWPKIKKDGCNALNSYFSDPTQLIDLSPFFNSNLTIKNWPVSTQILLLQFLVFFHRLYQNQHEKFSRKSIIASLKQVPNVPNVLLGLANTSPAKTLIKKLAKTACKISPEENLKDILNHSDPKHPTFGLRAFGLPHLTQQDLDQLQQFLDNYISTKRAYDSAKESLAKEQKLPSFSMKSVQNSDTEMTCEDKIKPLKHTLQQKKDAYKQAKKRYFEFKDYYEKLMKITQQSVEKYNEQITKAKLAIENPKRKEWLDFTEKFLSNFLIGDLLNFTFDKIGLNIFINAFIAYKKLTHARVHYLESLEAFESKTPTIPDSHLQQKVNEGLALFEEKQDYFSLHLLQVFQAFAKIILDQPNLRNILKKMELALKQETMRSALKTSIENQNFMTAWENFLSAAVSDN